MREADSVPVVIFEASKEAMFTLVMAASLIIALVINPLRMVSFFENIVNVTYAQDHSSINTNAMGMREMQARVFAKRNSQYLLIKAPPTSGKSHALMFVALDKLLNQGIKKVIVAVPEQSIGGSFAHDNARHH